MTERRAINDALVAAREEADRANMAKSRFLATASHDLRQPLQTIRLLNASLLTVTPEHAEQYDLLRRQQSAIDSASRMLNSLLDITRLESGSIEPHVDAISFASVYADLKREFEPLALAKGLRLEFAPTARVLMSDRILFMQLLQNIIGNAIKYTQKGFVRIADDLDDDGLLLKVEDSGCGVPAEKLDRIFDEYYQVDQRGIERTGVGLGLAIVREVSRILRFSVSVASEYGNGTTLRVRIPLLMLGTDAPQPECQAPVPIAHAGRSCRILLLEDNDSVRAATELFLTLEGYQVRSAASVADAQAMFAELQPGELLVSDYHLNGPITGLDVLRQIRTLHQREIPAILLSGDLQSMMRGVKTSIPHCKFLSKPVDTNALVAAVAELCGDDL
jgi:two-component system CheB/CheR fusion protein